MADDLAYLTTFLPNDLARRAAVESLLEQAQIHFVVTGGRYSGALLNGKVYVLPADLPRALEIIRATDRPPAAQHSRAEFRRMDVIVIVVIILVMAAGIYRAFYAGF